MKLPLVMIFLLIASLQAKAIITIRLVKKETVAQEPPSCVLEIQYDLDFNNDILSQYHTSTYPVPEDSQGLCSKKLAPSKYEGFDDSKEALVSAAYVFDTIQMNQREKKFFPSLIAAQEGLLNQPSVCNIEASAVKDGSAQNGNLDATVLKYSIAPKNGDIHVLLAYMIVEPNFTEKSIGLKFQVLTLNLAIGNTKTLARFLIFGLSTSVSDTGLIRKPFMTEWDLATGKFFSENNWNNGNTSEFTSLSMNVLWTNQKNSDFQLMTFSDQLDPNFEAGAHSDLSIPKDKQSLAFAFAFSPTLWEIDRRIFLFTEEASPEKLSLNLYSTLNYNPVSKKHLNQRIDRSKITILEVESDVGINKTNLNSYKEINHVKLDPFYQFYCLKNPLNEKFVMSLNERKFYYFLEEPYSFIVEESLIPKTIVDNWQPTTLTIKRGGGTVARPEFEKVFKCKHFDPVRRKTSLYYVFMDPYAASLVRIL